MATIVQKLLPQTWDIVRSFDQHLILKGVLKQGFLIDTGIHKLTPAQIHEFFELVVNKKIATISIFLSIVFYVRVF